MSFIDDITKSKRGSFTKRPEDNRRELMNVHYIEKDKYGRKDFSTFEEPKPCLGCQNCVIF